MMGKVGDLILSDNFGRELKLLMRICIGHGCTEKVHVGPQGHRYGVCKECGVKARILSDNL